MTFSPPRNSPLLPVTSFDRAELAEVMRGQFSRFAAGFENVPDALVLKSVMGLGALVTDAGDGPAQLSHNDMRYVNQTFTAARGIGLPVRFSGDYRPVNLIYGDDFLDYAVGERSARADIVIAQYIHSPPLHRHRRYHPQGKGYQDTLRRITRREDGYEDDIDLLRYNGLSRHLPFNQPHGDIYARAAEAVGASAVVVFGGVNTLGLKDFDHHGYHPMGRLVSTYRVSDHGCHSGGYLLLHRDYLAALRAADVHLAPLPTDHPDYKRPVHLKQVMP